MTQAIEVEAKLEVTEGDFHALLHAGAVLRRVDQLNIYFDDGWRLADAAATCRVRLAAGMAHLTVKLPVSWEGGTRTMCEVDQDLNAEQMRYFRRQGAFRSGLRVSEHLQDEVRQALLRFGVRHLACAGWMRTSRYLVEITGVGEFELDRVRLPNGHIAYEAEIEEPNAVLRERLVHAVKDLAPSARPVTMSKFERFRQAIVAGFR